MSYGYPEEWENGKPAPSPRLLKGYVQRFIHHRSHLGYEYQAVELSFGCPAGLSGSSLINPAYTGRLYGIVTENKGMAVDRTSTVEVDENGNFYKEVTESLINYGVALWLPAFAPWIDQHVPLVPQEEIARRAENQHKWNVEERTGC